MASGSSEGQQLEVEQGFTVRINLVAVQSVSDELLEDLAMQVEDELGQGAADIAPGASASANFTARTIELDFTTASSALAIHGVVGEVTRIALEAIDPAAVAFESSATSSLPAYA